MADNNSILSSKKLLSQLLTGKGDDTLGEELNDNLQNRNKTKSITDVIEDDNKDLIRVLKRWFVLDEFAETAAKKAKLQEGEKEEDSGGGIMSLLKGLSPAIAAGFAALSAVLVPALAVAVAGAVGVAIGTIINKMLPQEAKDAIGDLTARTAATLGSAAAQQAVASGDKAIRLKYAEDVRAAMAAGKTADSVPVPYQLEFEIGQTRTRSERINYAADSAYGNTIGRIMPFENKSKQRADQYKNDTISGYVDRVDDGGNVRPAAKPASSAVPNRVGTAGSDGGIKDFDQELMRQIAEGEQSALGYDSYYGKVKLKPPKPVTQMTLGEVKQWQRDAIAAGSKSTAAGKYQIVYNGVGGSGGANINDYMRRAGLTDSDMFSPENQDKMAFGILKNSVDRFKAGKLSAEGLQDVIAGRYASQKKASGVGAYDGDGLNKARHSTLSLLQNYQAGRTTARPQAMPEPLREPVEPVNTMVAANDGGDSGGSSAPAAQAGGGSGLNLDNILDIPSDDTLMSMLKGVF